VEIDFISPVAEDVMLVVDSTSFEFLDPAPYAIDIRRSPPAAFVADPREVSTGNITIYLAAVETVWTAGTTVDFGTGFAVTDVRLDGDGLGAEVDITIEWDVPPGPRDGTVTTSVGTFPASNALVVRPYLYSDSCGLADGVDPLVTGPYEGATLWLGGANISPEPCALGADGPEQIFRVVLGPGETLEATVDMPGFDPVLYIVPSCEEPPLACSDQGSDSDPEYLSWVAPAEGATVYLIIDGVASVDEGEFTLEIEMNP
jgi:hypothetical protein